MQRSTSNLLLNRNAAKVRNMLNTHKLASKVDRKNSELQTNTQLLKDLVKIIKVRKTPYIKTRDLIAGLCADPLKRWASYYRGSNITARQLSGLLKPYGVSSCCIYYKEGNAKGYNCESVRLAYRSTNADRRFH